MVVGEENLVGATVTVKPRGERKDGQVAKDGGEQQSRTISNFWFECRPRGNHA